MVPSMSRPANPYDNASCESFIKTLKREEIYANEYVDLNDQRLRKTSSDWSASSAKGLSHCSRQRLSRPLAGNLPSLRYLHRPNSDSEQPLQLVRCPSEHIASSDGDRSRVQIFSYSGLQQT